MPSVGSYLRELRERRGVSIEETARSTRIPHEYLEALEAEAWTSLPAPVFTKGFIRAYCQALGESPERALLLWAESAGAEVTRGIDSPALQRARAHAITRAGDGRPRRQGPVLVSFVLLVVLGIALFVTTLALQSWRRDPAEPTVAVPTAEPTPSPSPAPGAPAPVEAVASAPPIDRVQEAMQSEAAAVVPSAAEPRGAVRPGDAEVLARYRLVARTNEATWIRVRTGDGRSTEETIPPGEVREWVSDRPFVLTIGNAGGITFELNGRELPPFGRRGEVITRLVLPSDAP